MGAKECKHFCWSVNCSDFVYLSIKNRPAIIMYHKKFKLIMYKSFWLSYAEKDFIKGS